MQNIQEYIGMGAFALHIITLLTTALFILIADHMAFNWMRGKVKTLDRAKLAKYHKVVLIGLGLMILSGAVMVSGNISGFLANTNFLIKMVFVLGLVINSFAIGKLMKLAINNEYKSLKQSDKSKLILSGVISAMCWLGALTAAFTIEDGFTGETISAGGEQVVSNYLTDGKASTTSSYSLAEVATHNLEADCWTMIGGNVYNISKYVKVHPGGVKNIMRVCGVDGTDTFTRKHAGDTKPNFMLKSMQIGVAAN